MNRQCGYLDTYSNGYQMIAHKESRQKMNSHDDPDTADEDAFAAEQERGCTAARQLVTHMVRMSASAVSLPMKYDGETYLVTVTKIPR